MNTFRTSARSLPVEDFLQALTAQLDRAQDALALKVSGTSRPLTWALKNLALELKVFVEVSETGKVTWRSAGPNEAGASTVHLDLTTITRPMVEENSFSFTEEADPRAITDLRGSAQLAPEDEQKLEWMGVRTIGQLRRLDPMAVQAVMNIPVTRLQSALAAAAHPAVFTHDVVQHGGEDLLRINGANLSSGRKPEVRLDGAPVEVVRHSPQELLLRPSAPVHQGKLEITAGGRRAVALVDVDGLSPAAAEER